MPAASVGRENAAGKADDFKNDVERAADSTEVDFEMPCSYGV